MDGFIPLLPLFALLVWTGTIVPFIGVTRACHLEVWSADLVICIGTHLVGWTAFRATFRMEIGWAMWIIQKKKNILHLNFIYFWRWIHSATKLSTQITTTCHVTTITTNVIFVLYTNFKGYCVCNWFFAVITIPESLLSTSKLCTVA